MNQRQIGIVVLIAGIILASLVYGVKVKEDYYVDKLMEDNDGQCILDDGYCLHEDRNWSFYIITWVLSGALIILGVYLIFFDRAYQLFAKQQEAFVHEVKEAKAKDEFQAYLAGFTKEEQHILKAIHEQEGIKQSTLRFRTGMSKTTLSLLLNSLEKRDVVSKKAAGKTNELYLRKKF